LASLAGDRAANAWSLLARYVPDGSGVTTTAADWSAWVEENRAYLFFSDTGGYRWYIDPLAKRRGVRTADLRGSARATRQATTKAAE
jgi:hypothetical protein